ncbi:hypothetical protein [Paenibacillus donghaensis]|uniref:Uncharacterized protein n=1 Tax=Paenibacillus donghaensis TaxID=414771 RepID=A0A2Z2KHF0_9BACL|nr:hypothetical protein [Paenibacillus donghaensis]ASA20272.1 hypothetical protein B9T62_05345 [Paenibacillus donghaensis]
MDQEHQEREDELLRASFMGDIREDVQFLGLSLGDIGWIVGTTLVIGGLPFLLPVSVVFKLSWILVIFIVSTLGHMLKWPYRLKRYIHDVQRQKEGTGEELGSFLGVEEDGWLYRSGKMLHVVSSLSAAPWKTAVYGQKRTRIGGFEQFLRAIVQEGFSAQISAEQIPDVRQELWNEKRNRAAASDGIQQMKLNRIEMWERLARNGEALRSEYTLTLTTSEAQIKIRERADEPADLSPEEVKRFRMLSELQEKKDRVLNTLSSHGGHTLSLLSGFSLPEILGRWWDRTTWEAWKMAEGTWEEPAEDLENLHQSEDQEEIEEDRSMFSPSLTQWIQEEAENEASAEMKEQDVLVPLVLDEEIPDKSGLATLKLRKWPIAKWLQRSKEEFSRLRMACKEHVLPLIRKWATVGLLRWQTFRMRKAVVLAERVEQVKEEFAGEEGLQSTPPVAMPGQLPKGLRGIVLLTSPAPSGVSFLAANLGVSRSFTGITVSIVDLSTDQGVKTVLNPLRHSLELEEWDIWTGKAANWLLFTPSQYPSLAQVEYLLQRRAAEDGLVIAEIPWNYPQREALMQRYRSIAVVDCDYHHWLQFTNAAPSWGGDFWLNQSTPEMVSKMSSLLKEQYQQSFTAIYPYFSAAAYGLYQGRPLALDPELREMLNAQQREEEADEPAQTYESVG